MSIQLHRGEIVGIVGPERRRQDHPVRPRLGIPGSQFGSGHARRPRHHAAEAATARAARAGPLLPGRPALRRPHRAPDGLRRYRPAAALLGPHPGDALLPERAACRAEARQARRRAHRDDGSRRLPRQVRVRPLDRKPPDRRPRLPDRDRPQGDPVRRTVVGHRAARDRGARSAAAAHPRHHRRRHPAHRARHGAGQLGLRPDRRLRPRTRRRRRRLGAGAQPPARPRVVSRIDPRGDRTFGTHDSPRNPRGHTSDASRPTRRSSRPPTAIRRTSAGSGDSWPSTGTRSASRAPHCSGCCCDARSAR